MKFPRYLDAPDESGFFSPAQPGAYQVAQGWERDLMGAFGGVEFISERWEFISERWDGLLA